MSATQQPPKIHRLHGVERVDEFDWLRDPNWREVMRDPSVLDQEIRAHLEAENAATEAAMAATACLRDAVFEEIRGRTAETDSSVPAPDGPYDYYHRIETGEQYGRWCRRPRGADADNAAEQILLDGNAEAGDSAYCGFGSVETSPDHRFMVWSVDRNGSEVYGIRVRELSTGEDTVLDVNSASANVTWAADSETLYYTTLDDNHRTDRVWRCHRSGGPSELVYAESDAGFFVSVGSSSSHRHMIVYAHDHTTDECHVLDATDPKASLRCIQPRIRDLHYDVDDWGDRWLILTNRDGAVDFKLMTASLATRGVDDWRDYYQPATDVLLHEFILKRDYLVVREQVDGLPRLGVCAHPDPTRTPAFDWLAFDEACYALSASGGLQFDDALLRVFYSSPATPPTTWDMDLATGERVLRKQQRIPSGHRPEDYTTGRSWATAPDGEQVPVSFIHRADRDPSKPAPLFLYGYGAYGSSTPAGFSASRLSLVDRGVVCAIAHVRGGMERGYRWYTEGKLEKKPNTFGDFIAVTEHLIDRGLADANRCACYGGSAGGLLIGAVVNQRPDLFAAAVADVPFVDVLNTMCDASLPLTPPEWQEWGNPIESASAYRTIAAYSPYDNLCAQAYPAMLVLAGLTDPRVTYWEPAKWVARLRETRTNAAPLLLKTRMDAGHGGASGRYDAIEETAFIYGFVLDALGARLSP
ncbi:MAG: S9 family peptidase [Pseudomonadota bacterium]